MLTRVRVRGYKSLHDVDVRLNPLTVLCGPNSSGKSNFLDALRLLSGIVTKPSLRDAFESSHRGGPMEAFPFEDKRVRGLPAKGRLAFSLEADLRLSDAVVEAVEREARATGVAPDGNGRGGAGKQSSPIRYRNLRYRVEIEMSRESGLCVADERLVALNARGRPAGGCGPFIEREGERLRLRWEGRSHPSRYDRHLGRSVLSTRFHAPHHPHAAAVRKEMERWQFFHFEPQVRMRGPLPPAETRRIGTMGEDLSTFFLTLKECKPRKFDVINLALPLLVPGADGIGVGVNRLGDVELSVGENGTTVSERSVSDGTLRVLGLLALGGVGEPPALIGLEEPETGVHPERVGLVALLLENRTWAGQTQCVVTTHSTVLLDRLPEKSLLFARKVGDRTEFCTLDDWPPSPGKVAGGGAPKESDVGPSPHPVSHRILRGDLGG